MEITAQELFRRLRRDVLNQSGYISFSLGGTTVIIDTTDTVGNSIQSWLGKWMEDNDIYCDEPTNTQEFPDFFLSENDPDTHMLEVKAFNYNASPAFDIANYESYVESVAEKPYRLFADYIVFGYVMDDDGKITIRDIWKMKIWELAGTSKRYALNTQIKRDVIYNIRPNSKFKNYQPVPFSTKEQFLKAMYDTHCAYRGKEAADSWKQKLQQNYMNYYNTELNF